MIGEIPVGGVKLFTYPTPKDPCILVRTASDTYVAYSQIVHAPVVRGVFQCAVAAS